MAFCYGIGYHALTLMNKVSIKCLKLKIADKDLLSHLFLSDLVCQTGLKRF